MTHKDSRLLKELVIIDAGKGLTAREIAEKYSKTTDYVYNICWRNGIKIKRSNKINQIKFSTFLILKELFSEKSLREIAEQFNISKQRVYQIYEKAKQAQIPGLPMRS